MHYKHCWRTGINKHASDGNYWSWGRSRSFGSMMAIRQPLPMCASGGTRPLARAAEGVGFGEPSPVLNTQSCYWFVDHTTNRRCSAASAKQTAPNDHLKQQSVFRFPLTCLLPLFQSHEPAAAGPTRPREVASRLLLARPRVSAPPTRPSPIVTYTRQEPCIWAAIKRTACDVHP
jgi:hypothetical protein